MSACIYDDLEAVTTCPGCEFGVCQSCLDDGADGVCRTCAEERAHRREHSALAREYEASAPEVAANRCTYCRALEDDETPLDGNGYCPTCGLMSRCQVHADLIAVDRCKSCHEEFCRRCLGFTNICQACTAKPKKQRPPRPPGAGEGAPTGARSGAPRPTGDRKKAPAGKMAGKGGTAGKKRRPAGAPPAKGGAAAKGPGARPARRPAPVADGEPRPARPTRGRDLVETRLKSRAAGQSHRMILVTAVIGAISLLILVGGFVARANSPEAQSHKLQTQMIAVHKAVLVYRKRNNNHLPTTAREVYDTLATFDVKSARQIKVVFGEKRLPGAVRIVAQEPNFQIGGLDSHGEPVRASNGQTVVLDQYFQPPDGQ